MSNRTFFSSDYRTSNGYERAMELMDDEGDDSQNVQSDIDSQVSVPCNLQPTCFLSYLIVTRCLYHDPIHCHENSNSTVRAVKL